MSAISAGHGPPPRSARPSAFGRLADWWLGLRARLVADPAFQRFATAFPLTRPLARRRAAALFALSAGFVYSQVLAACIRLRLFKRLANGPLTAAALARDTGLPLAGMERLLRAAVALGLLHRRAGHPERYLLADLGAACLANPGVGAMVEHHAMLYRDLADPVGALARGPGHGELAAFWAYARAEERGAIATEATDPYTRLMASSVAFVADDLLAAYPVARHRHILDVAGGDGTFLRRVAAAAPTARLSLFDLPAVAERARHALAEAGLAPRVSVHGGDLFSDPLPEGADLITLVRVLHDHDDGPAAAILAAVRRALPPGGTLLIAEPLAGTPGSEPMGDAYFGIYLFAMGSGRPRSTEELTSMLRAAGFRHVRTRRTRRPLLAGLIEAQV